MGATTRGGEGTAPLVHQAQARTPLRRGSRLLAAQMLQLHETVPAFSRFLAAESS